MDAEQYIDLLKHGPQVWNEWRERHPEIQPNFHEEDMSEVPLRDTDLHEADLSQVHGLTAEQLGGANLSGAQLPTTIQKFERLAEVDTLAQNGQKLLFSLLLACLYSWLTVATTTDVRLLTNSASSPLPLVGTTIPIVGFYIVAPLILLSLYLYCHLYLQRYWEGLAALPAIFPDGRSLDRRIYPWLLSDFVHSHFSLLKKDRSLLAPLQVWLPIFLVWAIVPLTLFVCWGRYLSRHDWSGTIFLTLLLAIAVGFGVFSYLLARSTLRGAIVRQYERSHGVLAASISALMSTFLTLLLLSFGVMYGAPPSDLFNPNPQDSLAELIPQTLSFLGFNPFVDFTGADVSIKPENWDEKDIRMVKGAQLSNRDLRYVLASHAFLVNADLRNADLRGANLEEADLRGAKLEGADLRSADLLHADLHEASLKRANLWGAYLGEAQLQKTMLQGAILGDANLERAQLQEAQLQEGQIESRNGNLAISGADLQRTHLWNANFSKANLQGVKFWQAELYGADFSEAHLENADFQKAFFGKTKVSRASFTGAYIQGVDLGTVEGMTEKQFESTIFDEKTHRPETLAERQEEQVLGVVYKQSSSLSQ